MYDVRFHLVFPNGLTNVTDYTKLKLCVYSNPSIRDGRDVIVNNTLRTIEYYHILATIASSNRVQYIVNWSFVACYNNTMAICI